MNKNAAMTLSATSGTVTVKNAAGKTQKLRTNMSLFNGYSVITGSNSSATVRLDEKSVIKLDNLTEVEIRKAGNKLEVFLVEGDFFCDVEEQLESSETLSVRTALTTTKIKGTSVEFVQNSDESYEIKYYDGHGETTIVASNKTVEVQAGSKLVVSEDETNAKAASQIDNTQTIEQIVKMDDITKEMSASAAEEVQKNEALAERIAETFGVSSEELQETITESLPEMKERDEQKQEEVLEEKTAEESTALYDNLTENEEQLVTEETQTSDYVPQQTPAFTGFTIKLPLDNKYYNIEVSGSAIYSDDHGSGKNVRTILLNKDANNESEIWIKITNRTSDVTVEMGTGFSCAVQGSTDADGYTQYTVNDDWNELVKATIYASTTNNSVSLQDSIDTIIKSRGFYAVAVNDNSVANFVTSLSSLTVPNAFKLIISVQKIYISNLRVETDAIVYIDGVATIGAITNYGDLSLRGDGYTTITGTVDNKTNGALSITNGTTTFNSEFNNNGDCYIYKLTGAVNNGTIRNYGSIDNQGTLTNNGTFTNYNSIFNNADGSISVIKTIANEYDQNASSICIISNAGIINISSGMAITCNAGAKVDNQNGTIEIATSGTAITVKKSLFVSENISESNRTKVEETSSISGGN